MRVNKMSSRPEITKEPGSHGQAASCQLQLHRRMKGAFLAVVN